MDTMAQPGDPNLDIGAKSVNAMAMLLAMKMQQVRMGVDLVEQGRQQVNSAFLQNMAFTCFKDNGEVLVGSVEGRCGLAWLLFTLWGSVWEAFERNATPDTVAAAQRVVKARYTTFSTAFDDLSQLRIHPEAIEQAAKEFEQAEANNLTDIQGNPEVLKDDAVSNVMVYLERELQGKFTELLAQKEEEFKAAH